MTPFFMAMAVAIGAPALKDKPLSLIGEWVIEQSIDSGRPAPISVPARWIFKGDGNWSIVESDGKEQVRGRFTTDRAKAPATLDLDIAGLKLTHPCIYKVDGDVLTVVLAAPQTRRPTVFESAVDSGHTLHVLKRTK